METGCGAAPPETRYFDEVFDEEGRPRRHYEAAVRFLQRFGRRFIGRFPARSRRLSGDLPLTAMPRILSRAEHALLARGTAQRARAIRALYLDSLAEQTFRDAVIPGAVFDAVLRRTGETRYREILRARPKMDLRAFYGPDIVRAEDGKFYVLEDNIHFVGGAGDLEPARAVHEALLPGFARAIGAVDEPRAFLDELCTLFHAAADPPIGPGPDEGALVVYGTPPYGDEEDQRLYEMLTARGAIVVEPGMKDRRIEVRDDGAYLIQKVRFGDTRMRYEKRIGFLWMNAEHAWVDGRHPAARERALREEAQDHLTDRDTSKKAKRRIRDALRLDPTKGAVDLEKLERALRKSNIAFSGSALRRSLLPGILDLMLSGRLQTNATPGIEFLGDKVISSYLPDLVRFYLKEEPILPNVPTHRLFAIGEGGAILPDRGAIARLMAGRERHVVKVADGRGGDGVHLGPRTTPGKWRKLGERMARDPARWIAQDYTHPSVLRDARGGDARIVDCRLLSMIFDDRVLVTSTFWGRSNVLEGGDGKVNLSRSGTETVGYVVGMGAEER